MKANVQEAALLAVVMALVIFFCRVCPFLFFKGKKQNSIADNSSMTETFINFVEKTVPPLVMTVLTFNAISAPVFESIKHGSFRQAASVFIASAVTVIIHLWKKNPLFSIFGGTAAFMIIERLLNF